MGHSSWPVTQGGSRLGPPSKMSLVSVWKDYGEFLEANQKDCGKITGSILFLPRMFLGKSFYNFRR